MDLGTVTHLLFSTAQPVLPQPTVMRLALHGLWAIVLGRVAMQAAGKLPRLARLGLVLFVMCWTLLPGKASPAYWLGLAFQTLSLMNAAICLAWLLPRLWPALDPDFQTPPAPLLEVRGLTTVAVVLGWVLLLDTFAVWPVSIYAWGFGSVAFGVAAVAAALVWLPSGSVAAALPLAVLALFALTRLPTGNVWDALLDPWLWLALQIGWLRHLTARAGAGRKPPHS